MNKDNRIELYRFLFMIVIVINHVNTISAGLGSPIPLGNIFVEFFFFLTGFFTYSHIKRKLYSNPSEINEGLYPFGYTLKKIRSLVPYMVMTCAMYYFLTVLGRYFVQRESLKSIICDLSGAPFDLLLLQVTGISNNSHFAAWWYLSAVLFALPLVFILFYRRIVYRGGILLGNILSASDYIWGFLNVSRRSGMGKISRNCKIRFFQRICRTMHRRGNL